MTETRQAVTLDFLVSWDDPHAQGSYPHKVSCPQLNWWHAWRTTEELKAIGLTKPEPKLWTYDGMYLISPTGVVVAVCHHATTALRLAAAMNAAEPNG